MINLNGVSYISVSNWQVCHIILIVLLLMPLKGIAQAPASVPMTNQDVIKLTRAGLGDDVIIVKIGTSQTNFDTSTDAIVILKKSGVSDRVIQAMFKGASSTSGAKPSASNMKSERYSKNYPDEMGVYANIEGKWVDLPAEKANWKTGGLLKAIGRASVIGGAGADVDIYVNGSTSTLSAPKKVEFIIRTSEGSSPVSYELVKFTQKNDRREYKAGRSGFISFKSGPGKAAVPFESIKVGERTFMIKIDLEPGEYCFYDRNNNNTNNSLVYTFKVNN